LAKLCESWGVTPIVVVGHSLGEVAAACVDGIFSLEDSLKLIAARAKLISMVSVPREGIPWWLFSHLKQWLRN
jgi:acyl transferase domain-containing protein